MRHMVAAAEEVAEVDEAEEAAEDPWDREEEEALVAEEAADLAEAVEAAAEVAAAAEVVSAEEAAVEAMEAEDLIKLLGKVDNLKMIRWNYKWLDNNLQRPTLDFKQRITHLQVRLSSPNHFARYIHSPSENRRI